MADPFRVATFNVSLGRKGPGLLVRDLEKNADRQIDTVEKIIQKTAPDILLISDFDYDFKGVALEIFARQLSIRGLTYKYLFSQRPNSGVPSGLDLDGDGRLGGAGDAQGFGHFSGARAMAVLSRFPINTDAVKDFSSLLWKDLPNATLPSVNSRPFPSAKAQKIQRLSSVAHWDVPIMLPDGRVLHLLASHPTPPVFDGEEDRNGLRNADEIRFWSLYLDKLPKDALFVIAGDMNADPNDGQGSHAEISRLLNDVRVHDTEPRSTGAVVAARKQGGANIHHKTAAALDTVDWEDSSGKPGNMRVDYVLPSRTLTLRGSGVFWPAAREDGFNLVGSDGSIGSHHRLVWVDVK